MSPARNVFLSLTLVLSAQHSYAAGGFSCGSKLVSVGDKKVDVFRACGEPAWRQRFSDDWFAREKEGGFFGGTIVQEEWVYNFGPTQFLRHLYFQNGRLVTIKTGAYGYVIGSEDGRCGPRELDKIHNKGDALRRCGEPMFRDSRDEERLVTDGGFTRKRTVTVDEWTYNFGTTRFLRTLIFENGRLVDIEEGDRGD